MRKFLVLIAAAAFALVSCTEAPEVAINKESIEVDHHGGVFTFDVTSNTNWKIIYNGDDDALCLPDIWDGGPGTTTVTVNVGENVSTSILNHYLTVVAPKSALPPYTTRKGIESKCDVASISVTQGAPAYAIFSKHSFSTDYIGGTYKFTVSSNFPWEISVVGEGITVEPMSGAPGVKPEGAEETEPAGTSDTEEEDDEDAPTDENSTRITVTIDEYEGDVDRSFFLTLTAHSNEGDKTDNLTLTQTSPDLLIGNRSYKIKKMKDGRWWTTQNLCYAPKGITIGDGKCKIWYPCSDTGREWDSSTEGIIGKGLIYADAVAFNANITLNNSKTKEGAQGICPDGWYIPTKADYDALVGPNAPYYDAALKAGSIALLEEDGFNLSQAGYVLGSQPGFEGESTLYSGKTYLLSSSVFDRTIGSTTLRFWYALCLNGAKATVNNDMAISVSAYPYAGSVRCIKKK